MAGRFNKDLRPVLPGSFFAFIAEAPVEVIPDPGSIVLVPIVHNSGPLDEAVICLSPNEFDAVYGSTDTAGRRAVLSAFIGEGVAGKAGAAGVIVYRMAGSSVAPGVKALGNSTPATPALTLTSRYKGSRANAFRITTMASPTGGNKLLRIFDGVTLVEEYDYLATDIAALATSINANSPYFTGVANITGVALVDVSAVAVTGGDDGTTLATSDWADMESAVEYEAFGVMVPFDLTDTGVIATMIAWMQAARQRGKRFTLVLGGPMDETFSAHKTRAAGYNDEDVVAFGTGRIADSALYTDGTEIEVSTSQFAPRVAGSIARRGERYDLVNARFGGARIITGVTLAQTQAAATAGMTVLSRDGHRTAPVKILDGVTSYQGNDPAKPARIYNRIKFMRTFQAVESEITADQEGGGDEDGFIEGQGITERTPDLAIGRAKAIINKRVPQILQPNPTVVRDTDPPPTDEDDFIQIRYGIQVVPGLRQIFNTVRIPA